MRRITPIGGYGYGRDITSRNATGDMFERSDDVAEFQFRKRCQAAKDFPDGKRKDPDVTADELDYDAHLGADDFDRSFLGHRFGGAYDGVMTV